MKTLIYKTISYKAKSYALVVVCITALMVLLMLLVKISLVQKYQYAFTDLSHQVLSIRDEVFKIKISDSYSYDDISQSLVEVERQVQALQASLQNDRSALSLASLIVDSEMRNHADEISTIVVELVANLETLLRLKISQQYSLHTEELLQQELLTNFIDAESRMHIFALVAGHPLQVATTNSLFNTNQYQSLAIHSRLGTELDEQIRFKSQQVFHSSVSEGMAQQAMFWLSQVDDSKVYLLLNILVLIGIYSVNYRVQQAEQYRKEAKILASLYEVEAEKAQLSLVAEHAQDAIIITDDSGHVTWVNKGFVTLSGYQADEIKGKKPGQLLQGENTCCDEVDKIRKGVTAQQPVTAELINYHKDGSEYWIDIAINPIIDVNGELTNFIAVERDSTARKKMETELAQAVVKADVSNKAKSTFLATMSHELRTPLNGILGMAQIIEPNLENPEHRQQIQILLESGNHLTSLLNDILDFSKVEEGKLSLEHELFEFKTVIEPIINTYQPICNEKNIGFIVENLIEEQQAFKGDKARVRQIIYNLLSNAVKFTESGQVTLKFKQSIGLSGQSGIAMTVEDSGIGIRKERVDSIFEPFVQAESSTTRQYGGTGLGLSIVKQLVELMDGNITISSQAGTGTQFEVFLALERGEAEPKEAEVGGPQTEALPENIHILIAEDNKVNALVAKTFCQRLGHSVEIAFNGLEAVRALQHEHYDLVIMDNHMPEMDGIEATEYIRKTLGLSVPIFACTADVFKEAHDNMIKAGANHVLTKPLQEQSFRDALSQYCHLICQAQPAENQHKVVCLARHQTKELNTTEADINYQQLRELFNNDLAEFTRSISEFNEFAELTITQLITAYDQDDVAKICHLAKRVEDKASVLFSTRMQVLAKEVASRLLNTDSVKAEKPELERLQQLINLLEVNIHQNQRFVQGLNIGSADEQAS
ncbi:ATP-binding protein [Shewanella sp. 10N.261.52.F9]|uniref:hybrid sensor histidine kinase/response regulator n=1 Tax=Shewanella sp. 10N.261.52.F9 TaxID=3229684 RepID=UPI00354C247A